MKKGCLIAIGLFVALLAMAAVAAVAAYSKFDKEMGISEAPPFSHETEATPETRLRVVLRPELLKDMLGQLAVVKQVYAESMPPSLASSFKLEDILDMALPREAALLGTPDFSKGVLNLSLFVNEKRGGPALVSELNKNNTLAGIKQIKWTTDGMEIPERGIMRAAGTLAIPDTLEQKIMENWKNKAAVEPLLVEGGHHLEAVLDNRNGDALTLVACAAAASGNDWEELLNGQYGNMILNALVLIHDVRLTADLLDFDTLKALVRLDTTSEGGPGLQFILAGFWPQIVAEARAKQGLIIEGEPVWDADKSAIMMDLKITGLQKLIEEKTGATIGGAAS